MRLPRWIGLTFLLAASCVAGAQTMDDAVQAFEKKDYEKARVILEKLAAKGDSEAQASLAEMYLRPIGIPRDPKRGIELLEAAAKNGHAEAQFILGTELFKGVLMAPDKNRGLSLLLASARQKYAYAQYGLCVELSTDESQFYDAVQAYAWCRTSATKNHKLAERAGQRGNETLGKILVKQGMDAVQAAKIRAASYERQY